MQEKVYTSVGNDFHISCKWIIYVFHSDSRSQKSFVVFLSCFVCVSHWSLKHMLMWHKICSQIFFSMWVSKKQNLTMNSNPLNKFQKSSSKKYQCIKVMEFCNFSSFRTVCSRTLTFLNKLILLNFFQRTWNHRQICVFLGTHLNFLIF